MTRVRFVGAEDVDLVSELRSSETSRRALSAYEFERTPVDNAFEVETASMAAALALLNDLNWYVRRYCRWTEVLDPDVSEDEWLSRRLATRVYEREIDPGETREYLVVRGVSDGEPMEPLYARWEPPEYDLGDADVVLVTRVDESEFRESAEE